MYIVTDRNLYQTIFTNWTDAVAYADSVDGTLRVGQAGTSDDGVDARLDRASELGGGW